MYSYTHIYNNNNNNNNLTPIWGRKDLLKRHSNGLIPMSKSTLASVIVLKIPWQGNEQGPYLNLESLLSDQYN